MGTRPSTSKSQPRLLATPLPASQRYNPQNAGETLSDESRKEGEPAKRPRPNNPQPGSEMTRENRGTLSFKHHTNLTDSLQDGQVRDFFFLYVVACHAQAHRSMSEVCFLISNLFFFFFNLFFCITINGFSLEQTIFATTKKHTETTFHSHFFLLDSKSVTLIFRLYIFRLSPWIYRLLR